MADQPVHRSQRIVNNRSMARRERSKLESLQVFERLQVLLHVTIGRIDHDSGATHDVIAGEQPAE